MWQNTISRGKPNNDHLLRTFSRTSDLMTRHELRDLRWTLRSVAGEVAATGVAAVIADDNTDVAVIVSLSDYERLRAEH